MVRVDGKVAIITVGGQRMGRAFYKRTASDGAKVVVADPDG